MANKINYGLSSVYIASVTISEQGVVTFGTPVAMPGAVSLTADANGETNNFYADNTIWWTGTANNGYTGTLTVANVPDWFYTQYLGMQTDDNGNIVETANDQQAYFAMLFQGEGDEKATRHAFFYAKASRPSSEHNTQEDTIEPGTLALDFTAIPLPGSGVIKARTTANSTNYDTWFSAVVEPSFDGE